MRKVSTFSMVNSGAWRRCTHQLGASVVFASSTKEPGIQGRSRPSFYFRRKYSKFYALIGGWIFDRFGAGALFATAGIMALANSAFALTIPKPTSS